MRYRSKATGRYVSADFAGEHPDETYAVNRRVSPSLVSAVAIAVIGAALAAGLVYRSRR